MLHRWNAVSKNLLTGDFLFFLSRLEQKIEHAGYTRYILQRNPIRYDSEGDELDEDDEDSEADAIAAEENPFSEIALESKILSSIFRLLHFP